MKIIEKTKERKFAVAVIGFWGRRGVSFIFLIQGGGGGRE